MKPSLNWLAAGGLLVTVTVLLPPAVPLGVPGEWLWSRHELPAGASAWIDRLTGPVAAAFVVIGTWLAGERVLRQRRTVALGVLLPALFGSTLIALSGFQAAAPSPHREVKGHWIIYDRFASGYFAEAAFEVQSAGELLSGYEDRMREGDVLHEGTHPPGLYLFHWFALQLTESSPALASSMATLRSDLTEHSFRQLEAAAVLSPRLTEPQLAALTLVTTLTLLTVAAAPLAVFGVSILVTTQRNAWLAACLTMTIPGLIVFFPKSDVLFATTGTLVLLFAVAACTTQSLRRRLACSAAAAAVLFGGMLLSLAHLPIAFAGTLFGLLLTCQQRATSIRRMVSVFATAAVTLIVLCGVWTITTHCDLLTVWRLNLANHAGFYDEYPRTVWKWLLLNPLELAFSAGTPLFLMAGVAWWSAAARGWADRRQRFASLSASDLLLLAMAATCGLLWLSGRNSGEAARLWCFLTPWLAISASLAWSPPAADTKTRTPAARVATGLVLLVCQVCVTTIVAGRVNGFLQL